MSYKVNIAATFTVDLIGLPLEFWMEMLDIRSEIEIAPYSQVFRELLDTSSLFHQNENGINVILYNQEDHIDKNENQAYDGTFIDEFTANLNKNTHDFIEAVKISLNKSKVPLIIIFCPYSPDLDENISQIIETNNRQITEKLENSKSVSVIDYHTISKYYQVSNYYDKRSYDIGHIPYTQTYFISLATVIARRIFNLILNSYKVIVVDCDNTLWKGVCGEDGTEGIIFTKSHLQFQEFLINQYQQGKLICISSKNEENDVLDVFKNREEMLLKLEHITSCKINWLPKSQNIHELEKELNLFKDSFIFLDDNPLELLEVADKHPEILSIQINHDRDVINTLYSYWVFDERTITSDDKLRTAYYQQNIERQIFKDNVLSYSDYISGLELDIKIFEISTDHASRISQITKRVNQFNFTTKRLEESEIRFLSENKKEKIWGVELSDKFGEYGIVGVIFFNINKESCVVNNLLLSCRALGRGVEHKMLSSVASYSESLGIKTIEISFIESVKNVPARMFLKEIINEYKSEKIDNSYKCFTSDLKNIKLNTTNIEIKSTNNRERKVDDKKKTDSVSLVKKIEKLSSELNDIRLIEKYIRKNIMVLNK